MIRSQVVVLNVMYEADEDEPDLKVPPEKWDWDSLIDEPIRRAVEVLAYGAVKSYPRPGQED
jgi:hypothetical protein